MFSVNTFWKLSGYNFFDYYLMILDKILKRMLLIPGYVIYSVEDWGAFLVRQMLFSDWAYLKAIILNWDFKFLFKFWKGL